MLDREQSISNNHYDEQQHKAEAEIKAQEAEVARRAAEARAYEAELEADRLRHKVENESRKFQESENARWKAEARAKETESIREVRYNQSFTTSPLQSNQLLSLLPPLTKFIFLGFIVAAGIAIFWWLIASAACGEKFSYCAQLKWNGGSAQPILQLIVAIGILIGGLIGLGNGEGFGGLIGAVVGWAISYFGIAIIAYPFVLISYQLGSPIVSLIVISAYGASIGGLYFYSTKNNLSIIMATITLMIILIFYSYNYYSTQSNYTYSSYSSNSITQPIEPTQQNSVVSQPYVQPHITRLFENTLPGTYNMGQNNSQQSEPQTLYINTQNMNLRSGPGTEYRKITIIPFGTRVIAIETAVSTNGKNWVKVQIGNLQGWLNRKYLSIGHLD